MLLSLALFASLSASAFPGQYSMRPRTTRIRPAFRAAQMSRPGMPVRAVEDSTPLGSIMKKLAMVKGEVKGASEAIKTQFKRGAAPTDKGNYASISEQSELLELIQLIESANPTANPLSSDLIPGWWSLLYQNTADPKKFKKPDEQIEGPFLAAFKPITRSFIKGKGDYQRIDVEGRTVDNLVRFTVFGVPGYLNIRGSLEPTEEGNNRADVVFKYADVKVEGFQKVRIPLDFIKPTGWVETTYLDSEGFRVGRGNRGSVFVAVRTKNPPVGSDELA